MRLVSFEVQNFRSITSTGNVEVEQRTVLVGRNESGKTAILKALHGLKGRHMAPGNSPPPEMVDFTLARDFPRDRARSEFDHEAVVARTRWELSDSERRELADIWSRAAGVTHATIERKYKAERLVTFEGLKPLEEYLDEGRKAAERAVNAVRSILRGAPDESPQVEAALIALDTSVRERSWSGSQTAAAASVRTTLAGLGIDFPSVAEESLSKMEQAAAAFVNEATQSSAARTWLQKKLPLFIYLDEWEQVTGHHVISEFIARRQSGNRLPQDLLFDKLLKVADLNADELSNLLAQQHEERTLLTDRASRVFTRRLRELWKDRDIEVQFRIDAQHFDVLVKDRDTEALVPLDERSRGFRWYFSFYVTFTADTLGGDKENAILLLDEPGLFLHATAQGQLLQFFKQLKNQILYSTHSPFMIDANELGAVRTVTLEAETGTEVSADLSGDARTLFPLQAALGYDITQTLFVGTKNVIVEGVTDYWYLSSVAEYLREIGQPCLSQDIVLTPAGGAQKVSYLVALLTAQNLHVVVLLDAEPGAAATRDDLVKAKLIRREAVLQITEAFVAKVPNEADIEDLLHPDVFAALVKEAYDKELAGLKLTLNPKIPRIVPRFDAAFRALGLSFAKSRVARLFMNKMANAPPAVLTGGAEQRFSELLTKLGNAVDKLQAANRKVFS